MTCPYCRKAMIDSDRTHILACRIEREKICANGAEKSGPCAGSAADVLIAETASVMSMTETIPPKTTLYLKANKPPTEPKSAPKESK